jgi:KDO2-lipid IV(A) lauroyltransferase
MWEHMFLMMGELSLVPRKLHDTNWRQHIEITDREIEFFIRQLLSPRPIVVVSGHFGNFEVGGITAGLLGFPTFTVARPLDNVYLHRFLTRFREATGQFMLPKKGSAKQLDAILQSGGTMMLLGDQSAGPKGVWVEFFGRPASCHKAVALFSLVHRAPMLLAYSVRTGPLRFRIGLSAAFDPLTDSDLSGVKPLTQWYNDHLERAVRRYPSQYWWLHNRWKNKPAWQLQRRKQQRKLAGPHHRIGERAERSAETEHPSRRLDHLR